MGISIGGWIAVLIGAIIGTVLGVLFLAPIRRHVERRRQLKEN